MGKSREDAASHSISPFNRTNELTEASSACSFVTCEEPIGKNHDLYSIALYYCWFYELSTDLVASIIGILKSISILFNLFRALR